MRIAHVITRLNVGGAQENTIFTARGQRERGHAVDMISGPTTGPEGTLEPGLRAAGIPVLRIPHLVREIRPLDDARALVELFRLFRARRYDVVHTHSAKAGILGRLAARLAHPRCLVVHTVHGLSFHPYQNRFINLIYIGYERFADLFTDHYICVGEVMKERCLAAGIGTPDKYTVIYSGFELEPYREAARVRAETRRGLGIGPDEPVVGMIGRLFPLKGQDHLMRAFARLSSAAGRPRLLLVGDGILRHELETFAASAGIGERVVFTGLVSPDAVPTYVAAMDILAHASFREGLPRAVAQGFAGGRPVVAFDADGARELVRNGETGFLVAAGDDAALADRLEYLLTHPDDARAMGERGKALVETRFAWRTMVEEIEKCYRNLLKASGKADIIDQHEQ